MSLIESILAAEQKAQDARQEATQKVATLIASTRQSTEQQIILLKSALQDQIKALGQTAQAQRDSQTTSLEKDILKAEQQLEKLIKKNEKVALDYLLKKVLNL